MTHLNKHILLIEDDLIDQMAFTRMFDQKMKGFSYSIANSIKEAQSLLHNNVFDIVISDFNLADGTTFDLLKELNNTPVIIITGNEDDATVSEAKLELGAAACFTKDLDLDYLRKIPNTINAIFDKKSFHLDLPEIVHFNNKENQSPNPVQYSLDKLYDIFDGNKNLVKETILVFLKHKNQEIENLRQFIFVEQNCHKAKQVVHKMQSGFRVFGMETPEQSATETERLINLDNNGDCTPDIKFQFEKLAKETNIAIELLNKELDNF